jgi:hypothetical protein
MTRPGKQTSTASVALDGAADDLPVERLRVDDRARVMDGGVVEERELARLHVDLDDADVPGMTDEGVEDPEIRAVVRRHRRERVVVGRVGGEAAVERLRLCRFGGGRTAREREDLLDRRCTEETRRTLRRQPLRERFDQLPRLAVGGSRSLVVANRVRNVS